MICAVYKYSFIHLAYQNSVIRKNFTVPFFKYKRLKLKLRVFLVGQGVAMVTYCVTKIIPMCASIDKEWL